MPKSGAISILQGVEGLPIIIVFALLLALFMVTAHNRWQEIAQSHHDRRSLDHRHRQTK